MSSPEVRLLEGFDFRSGQERSARVRFRVATDRRSAGDRESATRSADDAIPSGHRRRRPSSPVSDHWVSADRAECDNDDDATQQRRDRQTGHRQAGQTQWRQHRRHVRPGADARQGALCRG